MNLTTDANKDDANSRDAIAEWRKTEIPGKPIVERDSRTFFWCPHHQVPSRGFPNGLCVCSHEPENHDAWLATKNNYQKKNNYPKESTPSSNPSGSKQLVMTDKLRRVLTTTQPNLSSTQIDEFISEVLKD